MNPWKTYPMNTTIFLRFRVGASAALSLLLVVLAVLVAPQRAHGATIVSYTPGYAAMGVSPSLPVIITFSTGMDTNLTTAQFFNAAAPMTPLATTNTWSADQMTLTCRPIPAFPQNATIIWTVDGQDQNGGPLDGNNGSVFMTGSGGPSVISVDPPNMATNVPPDKRVVFTFSAAMDTNSTWAQFRDSAGSGTLLPVSSSWSADHITLTCTPQPAFPAGKTILWNVVGQDTGGRTLSGGSGTFMTAAGTPSLISVVPAGGSRDIPAALPVVFTFSSSMNTNVTAADFRDAAAPRTTLGTSNSWNLDFTELTCAPMPYFPTNAQIRWTLSGRDAFGTDLAPTGGSFYTSGSTALPASPALVSRGELTQQLDAVLSETLGQEFIALAGAALTNGATITLPNAALTNSLQNTGWPDRLEFQDDSALALQFATNYPPGTYTFTALTADSLKPAALTLLDATLPAAPRVLGWQATPYLILGQAWPVTWDFAQTGVPVDHVQVCVKQDDVTIFATPLPDAPGALTGASNSVVIPAESFRSVGVAEVRLTAFSYTALDTNSIPGVNLRAAQHRTTAFNLRVVDGATPAPVLLTTNMQGVATGEPFLNPLFAKQGVRPLRYAVAGGTLPPGLTLQPDGLISGQATTEGTFAASVRVTDLMGQSSTQSLSIVTVPPPLGSVPRLENGHAGSAGEVVFDLVAPFAGTFKVERAPDLSNWTTQLTTNLAAGRTSVRVAAGASSSSFFRVFGPGLALPAPHPLTVAPVLNPSVTISAPVDSRGGILKLTNAAGYVFTLNVPPAALDRTETISMTDIASMGGLPLSGGLRAAVALEPDGLIFNEPARLDIAAPVGTDATQWMGFGARSDGSQFALQPAFNTNNTCSLYLWHFSPAGAGSGTSTDAGAQAQNAPDDPMTAMTQQATASLQACRADPSCAKDPSSISGELIKIYIQMADQVVIPKLKSAVQDDAVLDDALQVWLKWLKDLSLLGLYDGDLFGNGQAGELQKRVRQAGSLATQAIKNGMDKACQRCLQHEIFRIYRMMDLARMAALLGLDYTDALWSCVQKCLVFEISVESEIVSTDGSTIFSTHTKGKAKLKPALTDSNNPDPVVLLKLIFSGSGQWDITDLQHTAPPKCVVQASPASGRLDFPWVNIQLYKKRQVWVPGQGAVTTYVYDPDLTVYLTAGLSTMPKEHRQMICPPAPPAQISDIFGQLFHMFHNDEVVIPQPGSVDALVLPGPAFRITGFAAGGPEDVIASKPYLRTMGQSTENSLIELRHTPAK